MLRNKKVQFILSLLIAIALWFYVVGEINPTITANVNSIQVEVIGEDELEDMDLKATLEEPRMVNIVISGSRAEVNEAKAGEIKATVDVSNCNYGENTEPINIVFPDGVKGVTVVEMSSEKAKFNVE